MFGQDRLLKQVLRERFVVTLKSGPTFSALLIDSDRRSFRFGDVSVLGEQGVERPAAPGELYIDRSNVAYMQRVTKVEKE